MDAISEVQEEASDEANVPSAHVTSVETQKDVVSEYSSEGDAVNTDTAADEGRINTENEPNMLENLPADVTTNVKTPTEVKEEASVEEERGVYEMEQDTQEEDSARSAMQETKNESSISETRETKEVNDSVS